MTGGNMIMFQELLNSLPHPLCSPHTHLMRRIKNTSDMAITKRLQEDILVTRVKKA